MTVKDGDKTPENEDEALVDDLNDAFGDDEEEEADGKSKADEEEGDEEDDDEDEKGKKSDKKDDDKKSKKKSSAVIQKQKYRAKLKEAEAEIERLKGKKADGTITDDERKEQQANEFLAKKIKEVLDDLKKSDEKAEEELEQELEDEMEEVLEDNTDITEEQILEVCDDLEVRPRQAVKIIKREMKLKGKAKPKLPQPKRGSSEVDEDDGDKKKGKPLTFENAARSIKDKIKKGLL